MASIMVQIPRDLRWIRFFEGERPVWERFVRLNRLPGFQLQSLFHLRLRVSLMSSFAIGGVGEVAQERQQHPRTKVHND